jgi:SAM-dependent methyltransferase
MTAIEEVGVSFEQIMGSVFRLGTSVEVLTALGARVSAEPGSIPADIAAAIDDVLAAAGIPSVDGLAPPQRAMLAGAVRTTLGQAADVLDAPTRQAGWAYTDVAVLEGQGRASMGVPPLLAQSGAFGDVTSFLDVGTGVGWLAVSATQVWPNATVVGIDLWGPSLERARLNVTEAGVADRVEIREQSVTDLDDVDRFDLTWVPSFYMPYDAMVIGFERILAATKPGGHVAVGRVDAPPDPVAQATQRLRAVRDGGSLVSADELTGLLSKAGWSDVAPIPRSGPIPLEFVAGRKA